MAKLTLVDGQLDVEGHVSYGKHGGKFKGNFALRDVRLIETETNDTFLAWTSVSSRDLQASQTAIDIGELGVDGLECKLIIDKDKSVNLTRILHKTEAPSEVPGAIQQTPLP